MPVKPGWEGRYFEDFEVGDVYRCRLGRTVTETDNIWFTLLTNNTNQIHFNNEYGKRTEFGKCLINSALTLAIVAGMGVADVSENGFALGWDEIVLPNPLFAGDTLYSESGVVGGREAVRHARARPPPRPLPAAEGLMGGAALAGVRVVALEQAVSLPFCTLLLAALGADVVKIETPGRGDVIRGWDGAVRGLSTGFVAFNAGKRDVTIDAKTPEGGGVLHRLAPG